MERGKLKVLLILVLICSVIDFSKDNDQPRESNDKAVAQGNLFSPCLQGQVSTKVFFGILSFAAKEGRFNSCQ